MLRRVVPSFTVEVRRRPRTATKSVQDVQSTVTARPAAFERETHRVAAAAFEANTRNQPSVEGAASYPKRRILQSLIPEQPSVGQLEDTLSSAAASDRKARTQEPPSPHARKSKDRASRAKTLEAPSEFAAQLADSSSVGSVRSSSVSPSEGTAVSPGGPVEMADRIVGNSGDPAPRAKAERRAQRPRPLDDSAALVSARDQRSVARTDTLIVPNAGDDISRPGRKRTIMGRYVIGDELKPGERWKRRLSKAR
jgi:hypothetical protein